jgi:hypothetical protein
VHLSRGTIYGSPRSHSPLCRAAADDDADLGAVAAAAALGTAQSFAPTPAFLQLSATPAAYIMCLHIQCVLRHLFTFESTDILAYNKLLDTTRKQKLC